MTETATDNTNNQPHTDGSSTEVGDTKESEDTVEGTEPSSSADELFQKGCKMVETKRTLEPSEALPLLRHILNLSDLQVGQIIYLANISVRATIQEVSSALEDFPGFVRFQFLLKDKKYRFQNGIAIFDSLKSADLALQRGSLYLQKRKIKLSLLTSRNNISTLLAILIKRLLGDKTEEKSDSLSDPNQKLSRPSSNGFFSQKNHFLSQEELLALNPSGCIPHPEVSYGATLIFKPTQRELSEARRISAQQGSHMTPQNKIVRLNYVEKSENYTRSVHQSEKCPESSFEASPMEKESNTFSNKEVPSYQRTFSLFGPKAHQGSLSRSLSKLIKASSFSKEEAFLFSSSFSSRPLNHDLTNIRFNRLHR